MVWRSRLVVEENEQCVPRDICFKIALFPFVEYPAIDNAARYLPRVGASCYRFPFAAPLFLRFVWMQSPHGDCPMLKFTIGKVLLALTVKSCL